MTNIEQLVKVLPHNIDCALITSDINRQYFTGMKSSAGVCLIMHDASYLLIDSRYYEKACDTVKDCEVILLTDYYVQLQELLDRHNAKSIAVEAKNMTLSQLKGLQVRLKDKKLDLSEGLSNFIEMLRAVKAPDELDKIRSAQKIAEKAFENVLNVIAAGKTEREIAFELDCYMLKNGAEAVSFETIVLAGASTSLPHGVPSDKAIENNSFVLMDFGAVYEGYHSDMTRTVCVGEPTEEMEQVYNIVLEAQELAINAARAGLKCSELDFTARQHIKDKGYGDYFGHGLGHSVGLEVHEFPNANSRSNTPLASNVIMTIEPGIYLPKRFGVRIEDMIAVTSIGCENLTSSPKNLIKL